MKVYIFGAITDQHDPNHQTRQSPLTKSNKHSTIDNQPLLCYNYVKEQHMKNTNVLPTMLGQWKVEQLTRTQERAWYIAWCLWYYSFGAILGKVFGWWK